MITPENIKIFTEPVSLNEVKQLAEATFGDFVKGVVDIDKKILGLGGELHADIEAVLLEQGSMQANLWGINLYPDVLLPDMVEFDSMINIRPNQNNRSRGVEDPAIQHLIIDIITNLVGF